MSLDLSVVIPVYNSAAILPALVARLEPVLAQAAPDSEVILVNDGSADASWPAIARLTAGNRRLRGIDLMRNYGQHNALLCGIRAAGGRLIVTLDDDLQHPPEEIPRLLAALAPDVDVVYGVPERRQHGLARHLASRLTKRVLKGTLGAGAASAPDVSAFRLFRADLRQAFAHYQHPHVSIDVLLTWATRRFAAVRVRHEPRHSGVSNYTFRRLVRHAANLVAGFSARPLAAGEPDRSRYARPVYAVRARTE